MAITPVSYARTFQHTDWIDNQDRVQAGGDSGFNGRFHGIENEFDTLSGVVAAVNTDVSALAAQIVALQAQLGALGQIVQAPVTIGLVPTTVPFNPGAPTSNWSLMSWSATSAGQPVGSFAAVQAGQTLADGVLPLALPKGVKMTNLTVLGSTSSGTMQTAIIQELRAAPYTKTPIVTVNGFASAGIANAPVFDSSLYLYYIHALVLNSVDAQLRGFQITYQP